MSDVTATVLVVDDDAFSRAVVSRKVAKFSDVVEAEDGRVHAAGPRADADPRPPASFLEHDRDFGRVRLR